MKDPFTIEPPKTTLDYIRYSIFEPEFLFSQTEDLRRSQKAQILLKCMLFFALPVLLLAISIYLFIYKVLLLPNSFPQIFTADLLLEWQHLSSANLDMIPSTWVSRNFYYVLLGIFTIPFAGLLITSDLVIGLTWLQFGILLSMPSVLFGGFKYYSIIAVAILGGLVHPSLYVILFISLAIDSFFLNWNQIMIKSIATAIGFVSSHFACLFYPYRYYQMRGRKSRLVKNPYLYDSIIRLPLPVSHLLKQAKRDPKNAVAFSEFLFQYRPYQSKLAFYVHHQAFCGLLEQDFQDMDEFQFLDPNLLPPHEKSLYPTEEWIELFCECGNLLNRTYEQEELESLQAYYLQFLQKFNELLTLCGKQGSQKTTWNQDYRYSLQKWKEIIEKQVYSLVYRN